MNFVYKAVIAYNGSYFDGWQFQTVSSNTVQEFLLIKLKEMTRDPHLTLYGASRTDKGVHAESQVIKIETSKNIDIENFNLNFNQSYKEKIKIKSIIKVQGYFNPLKNILFKEYHYCFSSDYICPNLAHMVSAVKDLDIQTIEKACSLIKGTHDFKYFSNAQKGANTIRNIISCELEESQFQEYSFYVFKIQSSGFSKYMIRNIVSALFMLGRGLITTEDFKEQLKGRKRFSIKKAEACGLNLFKIRYKE